MIKVLGKAVPLYKDLKAIESFGCKTLELCLDCGMDLCISNKYRSKKFMIDNDMRIESVHVPKGSNGYHIGIGSLVSEEDIISIRKTFELADYFNSSVIVMHVNESLNKLKELKCFDSSVEIIGELLELYPNISIVLENIIPILIKNGELRSRQGYLFENVEIVCELRRILKTDRIGTCLDTAHIFSSILFTNLLIDKGIPINRYTIDDYLFRNREVCKLIHLADSHDFGLVPTTHCVVFENKSFFNSIMDLYFEYGYSCPITLEVSEVDYSNPINYSKMRELINNYLFNRLTSIAI